MTDSLRVALASAYHRAALDGADMVSATRALETVRTSAAPGGESIWSALTEVGRQAGLASDLRLVPALMELRETLATEKAEEDVSELTEILDRDPEEGWEAVRHRLARALARLHLTVVERILSAPFELPAGEARSLARWTACVQAIRAEKWDRALDLFEALGRDPAVATGDRAQLLARTAQIHLYFTRDRDAAARALDEARSLVEEEEVSRTARAEVLSAAGQLALESGAVEEGRRRLEEAIQTDPEFEDSYLWLGNSYLPESAAGDPDLGEAERWFNLGIERAPGGTLNVTGLAQLLGRPETYRSRRLRIAELKEHALRVTPRHRHGLYVLFAQIALDNGDVEEAERLTGLALGDDPSRPDAHFVEARIHGARGDGASAIRSYGAAYATDPEAFVHWVEVENLLVGLSPEASEAIRPEGIGEAFPGAPPARIGALSCLLRIGHGDWEGAEADSARAFSGDGDETAHRTRVARVHNVRGNRCFAAGEYAEAEHWYSRALEQTPQDSVLWGNLALALENQSGGEPMARWRRTLEALERAVSEGLPEPDPEYVQRRDRIRRRLRLADRYGIRALDRDISPKPVGLDVGAALLREVVTPGTLELSPGCLDAVERVRTRVRDRTGLTLPGIHFRDWTAAPHANAFVVLLNELPFTSSEVPENRVLAFADGEAGTGSEPGIPATDPLSGAPGHWVPEDAYLEPGDGPPRWSGLEFALHELGAVFVRNARTELHLDDVAALLESLEDPDLSEQGGRPENLHRITQVVRNLVAEGAPATELAAIVDLVVRTPTGGGVTALVEEARMLPGVRERLPGNLPVLPLLRLGPGLSVGVRTGIRRGEAEPALALPPEECQDLIERVRASLSGMPGPHAILVDDDLRPFVRWVLEIEFPGIPVLATREIDPAREPVSVVDLEPTPAGAER